MSKLGNGVIPSVFSRIFQILRSPTHHLFSLILRMNRPHAIAAAADNQVLESTLLYILSCINPVAEDRLRRQRTLDDLALLIRNVPTFKGLRFVNRQIYSSISRSLSFLFIICFFNHAQIQRLGLLDPLFLVFTANGGIWIFLSTYPPIPMLLIQTLRSLSSERCAN